MISRDQHHAAERTELLQEPEQFLPSRAVMHKIAHQDEMGRAIDGEQLEQARFDCLHAEERKEISGGALAQLIAEVEIRHGQPAIAFMKKGKATIEQDIFGDHHLTGFSCFVSQFT